MLKNFDKYNEKLSYYILDKYGNVLSYNCNILWETASCIKVFILIELFKQFQDGKIKISDKINFKEQDKVIGSGFLKDLDGNIEFSPINVAKMMIIRSDNTATNMLIDYLGLDNINNTIKKLGFKQTKLTNKCDYSKTHKFGQTTAYEYALVFQKLNNGEIISKSISEKILEILKLCQGMEMFKKGLPLEEVYYLGTNKSPIKYIASKSGGVGGQKATIVNARNDGGIISTKYGDLIISIFTNKIGDPYFHNDNEAIKIGGEIIGAVYNNFITNKGNLKI